MMKEIYEPYFIAPHKTKASFNFQNIPLNNSKRCRVVKQYITINRIYC